MNKLKRVRVKVKGIVQGVGFRPATYRYAQEFGITGFVMNTPYGVTIEAEGVDASLSMFLDKIQNHPPRVAKISDFSFEYIEPTYETEFEIITSTNVGTKDVEISPDMCVCKDCVDDIMDPKNRRYMYPFTNCTNCGPRFTIIKDRPYDRKKTSMSDFKMCPDCEAEYNSPTDRRFHAQPNACPKCGPQLSLYDVNGIFSKGNSALGNFVDKIKKGYICAVKGLGGYNIACDPCNKETVTRLRKLKDRPSKSFAVMMKDIDTVKRHCFVSEAEENVLSSNVAPIVLLKKKDESFDHVSPDNNYLGVMLPYTPLHKIILCSFDALIMTSANKRDEPIIISDDDIKDLLDIGFVDFVLSNNRQIINRCDDSIVMLVDETVMVLRRARGYVPNSVIVNGANRDDNISMGADLKNTFAIKKGNKVYLSQYIGDLEDERNYEYQQEEIRTFTKLLDFVPSYVNTDAHPLYQNNNKNYKKIYHHHAHAISVMAEHGILGQDVFAVTCDGTGYGTDGAIWGFEFLEIGTDYRFVKRVAHLKYFHLAGGEKALIEIDRIAKVLLDEPITAGFNSPLTSSLGRLFDGIASMCGVLHRVAYEAQAAIILQKYAENFKEDKFKNPKYRIIWTADELEFEPMVHGVLEDIKDGVSVNEIAYKFHLWIADAIVSAINEHAKGKKLVFSGGCFQNTLLCQLLRSKLKSNKITDFYFNNVVPTNDGGISLGQAMF